MTAQRRKYRPHYPRYSPIPGMMRDYNRTVLGITGMGLTTNLAVGLLGSLKK